MTAGCGVPTEVRGSLIAEMPGEREQVVVAQPLLVEDQHIVPIPSLLDGIDLRLAHAREVDTLDFGPQRAHWTHLDHRYLRSPVGCRNLGMINKGIGSI